MKNNELKFEHVQAPHSNGRHIFLCLEPDLTYAPDDFEALARER